MPEETNEATPVDLKVFDRNVPFVVSLKRIGKKVTLRFPTDEELIRREGQMRTYYRKGNSLPEIEGQEAADVELLGKIHKGGDELDDEHASRALEILLKANVAEAPERQPGGYTVSIEATGGLPVSHSLKEPSEKEIRKYRQVSLFIGDLKFGRQEAKTFLREVGAFYDKLFVSADGYAKNEPSAIPISHKAVAVNAVLQQIRAEEEADEVDPAENFS